MMDSRVRRYASLATGLGLVGLVAACGGTGNANGSLPAFKSLDATYQAVDDIVGCNDNASDPPHKSVEGGGPTGESVMCTNGVEVLWFESKEAQDKVYELYASAAGSAGSVYFVEGRNWLVVDYSEVAVSPGKLDGRNLKDLAEELDAEYTVEK
jgi:hypothetical protein